MTIDEMIEKRDEYVSILTNDDYEFLVMLDDIFELTNKINKHFEDNK